MSIKENQDILYTVLALSSLGIKYQEEELVRRRVSLITLQGTAIALSSGQRHEVKVILSSGFQVLSPMLPGLL